MNTEKMVEQRPNQQRGKTAISLIWIVMGAHLALIVSDYMQLELLYSMMQGESISNEVAEMNDLRHSLIVIISAIIFIISSITFIRWFRRAYYNLHQKYESLHYSEGWAAGAWFVPVISFYRPYKIMQELFHKTERTLEGRLELYGVQSSRTLVKWWWGLWITVSIMSNVVSQIEKRADSLETIIYMVIASIALSVIYIPLSFITVKLIKSYSELELMTIEQQQANELDKKEESSQNQ